MGEVVWLFLAVVCATWTLGEANVSVADKIKDDPDLSQFYDLISKHTISNFSLHNRQLTIFAPTNAAFQRYNGKLDESLVLYHMINLPKTVDKLGWSVSSELEGNPPLWVTTRRYDNYNDIYINNGKIMMSHSNYVAMNNNKRQVLHVIDEVLTPVVPSPTTNTPLYNPNAFQLLSSSESVDIGAHRLREFRQKVNQTGKGDIFNQEGKFTFFIPVDEGFLPSQRADMLDEKVIDGHVIPNNVLFTTPTVHDQPFETLAFGDNLKVTVSFSLEGDTKENSKVYIISNTLVGDSKHTAGVVQAEIVRANIPVRNGVIHLIQRPLMIVDMTVGQVFEIMKDEGPLHQFYQIMADTEAGQQFLNSLNRLRGATIFAPSNAAWQDDNLKNLISNQDKLRDILNMHLIREQRLSVDRIRQSNINQFAQVPTAAERKSLYFNVITNDNEHILTVEGGGVNATVIQADIAATNGVIHIIDKVLGVPHTTVLDKLRTDPMLNDTYFLGNGNKFNNQLNDTSKRFTYFVPRNKAWKKAELTQPSTIKKLFMADYVYHATSILERHLVIADIPYTMEKMKQMATASPNNEIELPSVRDNLRFRVEEKDKSLDDDDNQNSSFSIIWRNEKIHVFRPDVECTNGVIHVIDMPLLQEGDVRVNLINSGGTVTFTAHCFMLIAVKLLLI